MCLVSGAHDGNHRSETLVAKQLHFRRNPVDDCRRHQHAFSLPAVDLHRTGVESVGDKRFDMGNGFHVDYGSKGVLALRGSPT